MDMRTEHTYLQEDNVRDLILQKQLLSPDVIKTATDRAKQFDQTLFQHVMQYALISPEVFLNACVDYFQLPLFTCDALPSMEALFFSMPDHLLEKHVFLPISKNNTLLHIAIANPNDIEPLKTYAFQLGMTIQLGFIRYDTLYHIHNDFFSRKIYRQVTLSNRQNTQELSHHLLSDAIHRHASDIHLEPYANYLRIRFRIDGLLQDIIRFPLDQMERIISCIKVMSKMDITIKRAPQDGRFTCHTYLGFFKDCRVSSCPTVHGEKLVVRFLEMHAQLRAIEEIGLNTHEQKTIRRIIQQPQGLVLVTGPTGSGKTITLYTLLNLLNEPHRNINTLEDPVEIQLTGINQTQIHHKIGLTFSQTLRALLRQDPDVMMIGEIRDAETAEIAVRAAQTGHLVLSTLHTNSAAEAIGRLSQMGISPFHLLGSLSLIIAQRLVRKLCHHCKIPVHATTYASGTSFKEQGCHFCHAGFQGRLGIFELMPVGSEKKSLISKQASISSLNAQNHKEGFRDLWSAALSAVKKGLTTFAEIQRVIPGSGEPA